MRVFCIKPLKGIVAVIYYASLCTIVAGLVALVYIYFGSLDQYKLFVMVPVRLGEEVVYGDNGFVVTAKSSYQSSLSFIYFNRSFIQENAGLYWKIVSWYYFGALLITLMFHQVKQIMDSVGTVNVFSAANVFRIRLLGGLFLFDTVLDQLRWLWIKDEVTALLKNIMLPLNRAGTVSGVFCLPVFL